MKKKIFKTSLILFASSMMLGVVSPTVEATERNAESDSKVVVNPKNNVDNTTQSKDNNITSLKKNPETTTFNVPNNTSDNLYSEKGLSESKFAPALAGVYFIPGIGEATILATGAIVVGGVTIWAGSKLYGTIMRYAAHRTHRTKAHHDKHTRRRSGGNEKKKNKHSYNGKHKRHKGVSHRRTRTRRHK